jgi:hypothetical protein
MASSSISNQDEPLVNGHAIYIDLPWALTSISQRQFWTDVDLSQFGNGKIRILSVDVSEWQAPGVVTASSRRSATPSRSRTIWRRFSDGLSIIAPARRIDYGYESTDDTPRIPDDERCVAGLFG